MKNYEMIEHFKLVKNGTVEGIKCDFFKGSQGNILIPLSKITDTLKIKNEGNVYNVYPNKYIVELNPYYIPIYSPKEKGNNNSCNFPKLYLDSEGLRKFIEITKNEPEIISELDL
jgi:hypothetical protein